MNLLRQIACALTFVLVGICVAGCDRKEKVLDVETPEGELEIERDVESGDIDIEVRDKDDRE